MNRAIVVALIVVGLLAGIAAGLYVTRQRAEAPVLERATLFETPRPLPALALVDQAGSSFDRERFHGRWTFLFFGFVNCPDVCPTTLATLAEVRRIAGDLPPRDQPAVVLVSVDPGRDTPEVLAHYVAHFDPAFTGVTGNADAIEALTRQLGVAVIIGPPAADGNYAVDHTAAIFLVDPAGSVSALFGAPHEAGMIAGDFRRILAMRSGQE
jgi:protein SCO1/2